MNEGEPGWVGQAVLLRGAREEDDQIDLYGVAYLDAQTGHVRCTNSKIQRGWEVTGINGRASVGRVYPKDGQLFLDELPFVYRSIYFWAEPLATSLEELREQGRPDGDSQIDGIR